MIEQIDAVLEQIDSIVWGPLLILLIIVGGILLTIRTRGIQVTRLPLALKWIFKNEKSGDGELSSFGALMTALSATIGTGNIVGVATAVGTGGPGALFWMIVAALFGMATKYSEGLLAIKYRSTDEKGNSLGGPFMYIEKGMGPKWKWMAKVFAIFGAITGLIGCGTFTQINGIANAVDNFFNPSGDKPIDIPFFGDTSVEIIIVAFVVAILTALVILGGIKRISAVASVVVPFMAVSYFLVTLILIFTNITEVPSALLVIIEGAFNPKAITGGAIGSIFVVIQKGVARGIFSNEAGLGSAPIAAAATMTKEPVRQGLVSMTGTFLDTIVICTLTGLSIVLTGAWQVEGLEGVDITIYAFQQGLPFPPIVSTAFLMIALCFFAFTTILGWDYYSERCVSYLFNGKQKPVRIFKWLYIVAVFIGPFISVAAVWTVADIANGLMALPNMIALFALSGVVAKETKDFFAKKKHKLD